MAAVLENVDRASRLLARRLPTGNPALNTFGLTLAVREALTNAVVHGCLADPDKSVTCAVNIADGELKVEISDEGEGFDWRGFGSGFPEPDTPGTRGIAIMRHYFDELKYNEKGNKILLTKKGLC